jgi:hypothetical protein
VLQEVLVLLDKPALLDHRVILVRLEQWVALEQLVHLD